MFNGFFTVQGRQQPARKFAQRCGRLRRGFLVKANFLYGGARQNRAVLAGDQVLPFRKIIRFNTPGSDSKLSI